MTDKRLLELEQTYLVTSSRKGTFAGKLTSCDTTWATFEITAGKAKAMLEYNEREKGELVTVRREWCTFTEQPKAIAEIGRETK
jgi:hypothetical protein